MKLVRSFLDQWKDVNEQFLVFGRTTITYMEANAIVDAWSRFLVDNGVMDGNVAIFADRSIEFVLAYFANLRCSSTNIPINIRLTAREVQSELDYCDCNWIIGQSRLISRLEEVAGETGVGVIEITKDFSLRIVRPAQRLLIRQNTSEIVSMLHTSGTTGNPKKVMLSDANLCANTLSNIRSLDLTSDDVVLVALPMFFGYCHTAQMLTHTRLGGRIVLYDEPIFTAKHFCDLVQRHGATCFTAVPTMLRMLSNYRYLYEQSLDSLRYICFGGGVMDLDTLRELILRIPSVGFVHTYGQTECSPRVSALLPEDSLSRIGSVGKPIPGVTMEVVDECGRSVGVGEIGEIRVKGDNITPGYYRNPQETERILRDGYLYTGDLATVDSDAFVYLAGRKKAIIISGGTNIYPEEVEQQIMCHPAVDDVIVRGEPDPDMGEIVTAHVVPREGDRITIETLHRFLGDRLASYKWPRRLYITDALEKTATGKTKR